MIKTYKKSTPEIQGNEKIVQKFQSKISKQKFPNKNFKVDKIPTLKNISHQLTYEPTKIIVTYTHIRVGDIIII